MNLNQGSTLQSGKYQIIKVLGQGGFGITYLARHTLLDDYVAIKEFFPKDYCNREETTSHISVATQSNRDLVDKLRNRFVSEARILSRLNHPGIVKIHDIFEENETAYYVMDFVKGRSLEDVIDNEGPMSESRAVDITRRVGSALDYIHQRKMTHFDVKPANIMMSESDGSPVLIDFGLSKQYNEKGHVMSTLLMGVSHGYSPLEQYLQDGIDSFSPQTDVYALAATLYTLLTGRRPPEAPKLAGTIIEVPVNISQPVANAIKWGMATARENRAQTIGQFLEALDNKSEPTSIISNGSVPPPPPGISSKHTIIDANRGQIPEQGFNGNPNNEGHTVPRGTKRKGMNPILKWFLIIIGIFIGLFILLLLLPDPEPGNRYDDEDDVNHKVYNSSSSEEADEEEEAAASDVENEEEVVVETPVYPGAFADIPEYAQKSKRNGKDAYYYEGYFTDDNNKDYAVKVCFVDEGGTMSVIYKNVEYNVAPMSMTVVGNTSSQLDLHNAKNNFSMSLEPRSRGRFSGVAVQGSNILNVRLEPSSSEF